MSNFSKIFNFDNIGGKVKRLAKWLFTVEAIVAVIGAVGLLFSAENGWMIFAAIATAAVGPLIAWVSSMSAGSGIIPGWMPPGAFRK